MNDTSNWHLLLGALALFGLTACGESEQQLAAARSFSCTELAREIGKREQRHSSAQIDGFINTITSIAANDKSTRREADVDSAINSIDETDAEQSIEQLEEIYRNKGCPKLSKTR